MMRRCMRRLCAVERSVEEFDAVIIGGGPAGLSAAIRLKQLAKDRDNFRVALVEKGSEVGQHILSGACIETRSLDELLPKWRETENPVKQEVTSDSFYLLTKTGHYKSPVLPSTLENHGNYIVSLGAVCKWLGEQATELGVEIYPGFAAAAPIYGEKGNVEGVQLNDMGINKKGEKTPQYEPGMIFKAKQTIFAEGCRGSCTKQLEQKYELRTDKTPQSYGLGVKEVWEVPKEKFNPGSIVHTCGWPLTKAENHDNTYGGSFMYHYGENLMAVGFVIGLDYKNPYTRPYMELQKWKTHPFVTPFFEGAKPLSYGARTLIEGGYASLPKLSFPGGVLVGDCAGFLNLPKIKGTHTAMKSAILAADAVYADVFEKGEGEFGQEAKSYFDRFKGSWLHDELYQVRNVRQVFAMNFYAGALYTGLTAMVTKGREPWTLAHKHHDHETLLPAAQCKPIEYPKPDGKLTFDLLTNHSRSNTSHNADQPSHLRLKKWEVATTVNKKVYDGPVSRTCPAGVYEWVQADNGEPKLVINAQNCLHCKACDIKDPTQNINWCVPEGGGGPNYNASM